MTDKRDYGASHAGLLKGLAAVMGRIAELRQAGLPDDKIKAALERARTSEVSGLQALDEAWRAWTEVPAGARLMFAAEGLAAALSRASMEPPKPARCVPAARLDGRPDCPNCLALYEWEMAKRAYEREGGER